jgi:RNA polymerase sigma-B factor
MQTEQGYDTTPHDVSSQVQSLMEEYLQQKQVVSRQSLVVGEAEYTPQTRDRSRTLTTNGLRLTTDNSEALRQRVVEGMAPLVESIARRYAGPRDGGGEPLEDLVSEGYVGLLTAIDQYRVDRGARFSTYATHRVHGQIRHYLRDRSNRRLIRAPSWLQELMGRLQKEEAKLQAELGREPTTAELAERLNLREDAVEELQIKGLGPSVLSLTERSGDDEEGAGCVDLGKIRNQHYVSWQLPVEDHIFLEGLMGRLKELERKVITLFFYEDLSQSDIARSMDISCNYVGYLLKNGLRKLRTLIEADELRDAQLRVTYAPTTLPVENERLTGAASVIDAASSLYTAGYFRDRLAEEVARACRYRRSLAVVVFALGSPGSGVESAAASADHRTALAGGTMVAPAPAKRRRGRPPKHQPASGTACLPSGENQAGDHHSTAAASDARLSSDAWQEIGTALRECLRKADVPARLDDQTLAVALPHTGTAAIKAAERIAQLLSRVANHSITTGLALYPEEGRDAPALLEAACRRARGDEEAGAPEGPISLPLPDVSLEPAMACPITPYA